MRAFMLLGVALTLAWVAGWALAGTELSGPAAVAAFASLGMAVVPAAPKAKKQKSVKE